MTTGTFSHCAGAEALALLLFQAEPLLGRPLGRSRGQGRLGRRSLGRRSLGSQLALVGRQLARHDECEWWPPCVGPRQYLADAAL
jgi:hypothetical protein